MKRNRVREDEIKYKYWEGSYNQKPFKIAYYVENYLSTWCLTDSLTETGFSHQ